MSDAPPRILYLNTDLDLIGPRELAPLVRELESHDIFPLGEPQRGFDGDWYITLETKTCCSEPAESIEVLLNAIESARGEAEVLWRECKKRELNIGYDCGDEPWAFNNGLSSALLARMAKVGVSLRITIYPQRPPANSDPGAQ